MSGFEHVCNLSADLFYESVSSTWVPQFCELHVVNIHVLPQDYTLQEREFLEALHSLLVPISNGDQINNSTESHDIE